MTDRYHTLTVVLEKDMRDDDAEGLINAITRMRGVLNVSGVVADIESHMAQQRVRIEIGEKLMGFLFP